MCKLHKLKKNTENYFKFSYVIIYKLCIQVKKTNKLLNEDHKKYNK